MLEILHDSKFMGNLVSLHQLLIHKLSGYCSLGSLLVTLLNDRKSAPGTQQWKGRINQEMKKGHTFTWEIYSKRSNFRSLVSYPYREGSGHENFQCMHQLQIMSVETWQRSVISHLQTTCQSNKQLSKVIIKLDNCVSYMTYFAHFQTCVYSFHSLNKKV